MQLPLYQIDAFTDKLFSGNPACVVPLKEWLPDALLLNIAKENAVAETAFFIPQNVGFHLRWFTPEIEMDLCGHATLATAHALHSILNHVGNSIVFYTKSGELTVTIDEELYTLNFPSRKPVLSTLPNIIAQSLSKQPNVVLKSRDYILVYHTEQDVRDIKINRQIIDQINIDPGGIIITAKGDTVDFVSRFFTPQASIFEDSVTGSSHCSLIPYWAKQLDKTEMLALQISERGGKLYVSNHGERVLIAGNCKTYAIGYFWSE